MNNPISIPDLTTTQEFGTAPLDKKLEALDYSYKYNSTILDEATFDKAPLAENSAWLKSRSLLANTYGQERQKTVEGDLKNRLQSFANQSGRDIDPSTVQRILEGGDLDEEEDEGGKLRGIVDDWTRTIASKPSPRLAKDGSSPPLTSFDLKNASDPDEVLGRVKLFHDGHTNPYAEVTIPTAEGQPDIRTRFLLNGDKASAIKQADADIKRMENELVRSDSLMKSLESNPDAAEGLSGMQAQRQYTADALKAATERRKLLEGDRGSLFHLQEQVNSKLREAPYIDKIGKDGWINGGMSMVGSLLTSGMGVVPGVAALLGVGDETGPVQNITDPKLVQKLIDDNEAGKLEGQTLTPFKGPNGENGVTLRNETEIEKMQANQQAVRNIFPRNSKREFRGGTTDKVIVGAVDDALPFLADLYSGMGLAKGTMMIPRMAMAAKAARMTEEAKGLVALAGKGNAVADMAALGGVAKAQEASLVAAKNIAKYTTIPEAMIAAMPMTVKGAAHAWSDAMHTADEFDAEGQVEKATAARDNAFNSAWANFATGEGLGLLPMMRIMKNANGQNLLAQAADKFGKMAPWEKFLNQQVYHRAEKAAEFGAWSGASTMSSNAWAKKLYDENRDIFQGVPEATAIGVIHGFGLARFSGLVDPAEVAWKAKELREQASNVQDAQKGASEAMGRAAAGETFDNLPTILPASDVVDNRSDGKFVINSPQTPAVHGKEFNSREEAENAAGGRHREQFFHDIGEYQTRIGMTPEEVNAQNTALGASMDNITRLAGLDPERYYAAITVRDRPEGREGTFPLSIENMRSRLDNLYDLIGHAEKNKVPQAILDRMLARHEELRVQLGGMQEAAPSQEAAGTQEAQPGETPPVAKTSQDTPAPEAGTTGNTKPVERVGNPNWYKDRTIPQPQFEELVTAELGELQRLEAEVHGDLQAGKLPEDQYKAAVDWIQKRQSDLQAEEVARDTQRQEQDVALQEELDVLNFRLKTIADALDNKADPRVKRATPQKGRMDLLKERNDLFAKRNAVIQKMGIGQPKALNQDQGADNANASIYQLADQGQVIIETYKSANPTSLLHEVAHTWTLMKDPTTGRSLLEVALGGKAEAFNKWATGGGKVNVGDVEYHENVALGLEKYLAEGKAPTEELQSTFAKLARMFRKVYNNLKGSVPLPDEAREAYDRIFDKKAERDVVEQPTTEEKMTPEQVAEKLAMFEDGETIPLNQLNDPEFAKGVAMTSPVADSVMPETGAPQRLDQGPSKVDDWRTAIWAGSRDAKEKITEAWKQPRFWDKWEGFIPAGLRSRGSSPQSMFEAKTAAHGLKEAINTRAQILSDGLNNAVNDALGVHPNAANITLMSAADRTAREAMLRDVNSALMGADNPAFAALPRARKLAIQNSAIAALPPNVQPHVKAMRAHIDSLSRALVRTGAVQGPLVATLDANQNFYLHRAYEFFDNPLHGERVKKNNRPLMDQAVNEFVRGGMSQADARAEVNYLLDPRNFSGTKSPGEAFAKYLVDRRPTGIFKERTDIPEHIRKLWGEYKDPMLNYMSTIAKQATALTTFQSHLQALSDGIREGWLQPNKTETHYTEIFKADDQSPRTSVRKSPLSGYYTTPEIGAVFQEAQKQGMGTDSFIMSLLAGGNWMAKNAVFTWNPASHVRNNLGAAMLYFMNGHFGVNGITNLYSNAKDAASAHSGILPEFWQRTLANNLGMDRTAAEAERVKLTKLGLLGQNVDIGVLHALSKRFSNGVMGKQDALNTVAASAEGLVGKTQKGLEEAIQAEDSFWKVMHFYSEYKQLREAHPSTGPNAKTNAELEVVAAGRTLDVMPSWDRVVPWAKKFSSNPFFGTFVSFRAETMRNTYNALKIGMEDMKTPGMRWHGVRRIAGMTALRAGQTAAAKAMTKLAMGSYLDDETEKDVRRLMAPWDKDASHAFVEVGNGKIRHVNLSYIFPFSETIDAMRAFTSGEDIDKAGVAAFVKTFEPFLNEEFSLRLAHELAFNRDSFNREIYNPEDKLFGINGPAALGGSGINRAGDILEGKVGDAIGHGLSMFIPAIFKNAERVLAAYQGHGTESVSSAWGRILGLRVNEIDVRKQLPMIATDVANRLSAADDLFEAKFDPKNPAGHLEEGFAAMQERRKMLFSHLHDIYNAGIKTGVPVGEVIQLMDKATDRFTKESLSKEELVAAVTGNYIPPYRLSEKKYLQLYEKDPQRAQAVLEMTVKGAAVK